MKRLKNFMQRDSIPRNIVIIFLMVGFHFAFEFVISFLFGESSHQLAILSELITSAISGSKAKKAEREAERMRPKYEIPQEIFQNQAMYEAMANSSRLPGQAQMEENIAKSTANAIGQAQRGATSSADALSTIGAIQQNQNNVFANMGITGAQLQMANKDKLAGSRETVADYRQQEFDYNKNQPWKMKYAKAQKLRDESKSAADAASAGISKVGMSAIEMSM